MCLIKTKMVRDTIAHQRGGLIRRILLFVLTQRVNRKVKADNLFETKLRIRKIYAVQTHPPASDSNSTAFLVHPFFLSLFCNQKPCRPVLYLIIVC